MSNLDTVIFGKKKFSDMLQEIYNNQKKKEQQIAALINELKPLISDIGDATLIVPLIKEYLDIAVKNDDHIVKLSAIVQRYISTKQTIAGEDSLLSEEEKQQLLKAAEQTLSEQLSDEIDTIQQDEQQFQQKLEQAKNRLAKDS